MLIELVHRLVRWMEHGTVMCGSLKSNSANLFVNKKNMYIFAARNQ